MTRNSPGDLPQARRAIASALSKSEKALGKLKDGTWQHAMTAEIIRACRISIALIDREKGAGAVVRAWAKDELPAALKAMCAAKRRVEKALPKFAPGTPQHTLALRRIEAFRIAEGLLRQEIREGRASAD